MTRRQLSRRTVLSALGTGLAVSVLGATATGEQQAAEYVLVQGDSCVPVQPIQGQEPVTAFYDYELPDRYVSGANGASAGDTARYASAGTRDVQRAKTSIAFLYDGPERLSLVLVHGSATEPDGGSVTFHFAGLPEAGEWLVKDDLYRDPDTGEIAANNYDGWDVGGTDHRIDWTWGSSGTDGGAFGGLGDDFDVVVDPAFNEAAALYGEHYDGTVTAWEFLSGADGQERIPLGMDTPVRIATGGCEEDTSDGTGEQQTGEEEAETTQPEREDGSNDDDDDDSETYTVCHRPPGNPDNAHTVQVGSEAAQEAHLGHGDSRGACSRDE